jgi:cell division septal protein FtsQ
VAQNPETAAPGPVVSRRSRSVPELARLLPSGRSLVVGFALLAGGILAYVIARQTSAFALRAVEVSGAPPALERQVRTALDEFNGQSLLAGLPAVGSATFDRAFPHTLRVSVVPERPAAVLRSGARAWLVSAKAKVLRQLTTRPLPQLPRIWTSRATKPRVGFVPGDTGLTRAAALVARASRAEPSLTRRIGTVRWQQDRVTFVLRSGTELRLGTAAHLDLKLAVAKRLLQVIPRTERQRLAYIDLSVPIRPVAG